MEEINGRRVWGSRVLAALAALFAITSVFAVWVRNQVLDTDRYVENIAPLASDPAIQSAVARRITSVISEAADVDSLVRDVLPGRAQVLSGPIARGVDTLIGDLASNAVRSDQFEQVWRAANRVGHENVVAVLTGREAAGVETDSGRVEIAIGPLAEQVVRQLDRQTGLGLADRVPAERINVRFVLVESEALADVQALVRWLDRLAWILPVAAISAGAGAIALGRHRGRGLRNVAICLTGGAVMARLAIVIARDQFLGSLPPTVSRAASEAVFDILFRFTIDGVRALTLVGLAVGVVAWLMGSSSSAVIARSWWPTPGAGDSRPRPTPPPFPAWVHAHRHGAVATVLGTAGVAIVVWDQPGILMIATIAMICIAMLGVLAVLAAAGRPVESTAP